MATQRALGRGPSPAVRAAAVETASAERVQTGQHARLYVQLATHGAFCDVVQPSNKFTDALYARAV